MGNKVSTIYTGPRPYLVQLWYSRATGLHNLGVVYPDRTEIIQLNALEVELVERWANQLAFNPNGFQPIFQAFSVEGCLGWALSLNGYNNGR